MWLNIEWCVLVGNEGLMFSKFFINDKCLVFFGVFVLFIII